MTKLDLSHVEWRKSSRSSGTGQCVEVGVWRKSSRSNANGGQCVEVSLTGSASPEDAPSTVADRLFLVRDSKDPDGPVLTFTPSEWDAFLTGIKTGGFDAPA